MSTFLKFTAFILILTLIFFSFTACGVPDEEEFEELEEEPFQDDFGLENNIPIITTYIPSNNLNTII